MSPPPKKKNSLINCIYLHYAFCNRDSAMSAVAIDQLLYMGKTNNLFTTEQLDYHISVIPKI